MEDYVSFEQAIKLKELGFSWECNGIYRYHNSKIIHKLPKNPHKRKNIKKAIEEYPIIIFLKKSTEIEYQYCTWINSYYLDELKYIDAPTLSQAQKWLREEKHMFIIITCDYYHDWRHIIKLPTGHSLKTQGYHARSKEEYPTYEQALSAGIDKALELLK